jgi:hypothetical protein
MLTLEIVLERDENICAIFESFPDNLEANSAVTCLPSSRWELAVLIDAYHIPLGTQRPKGFNH